MSADNAPIPAGVAALAAACAEAKSAQEIYAAAATAAAELIGFRLFTLLALDPATMRVQRIYSSNPESYPPGGTKDKADTPWTRQVLIGGRPYIGRNADDIRENFNDYELLHQIGCDAILNVPVVRAGRVVGTMNLSGAAGHYDEKHIPWGRVIAGMLAAVLESPK
jgi:transcriptional regulator with GAF, ATPase, and Fis domain